MRVRFSKNPIGIKDNFFFEGRVLTKLYFYSGEHLLKRNKQNSSIQVTQFKWFLLLIFYSFMVYNYSK